MAEPPDKRKKAKAPAKPTRAKAARPPLAPIAPALEKLLNPGIAKGTAGVGSQTGRTGAGTSRKNCVCAAAISQSSASRCCSPAVS
jgi:excinuclease ABC subunit B